METVTIEIILGALLPMVIELIGRFVKGGKSIFAVSLILPLLAGVVMNYKSLGAGDVEAVLGSGAVIFASAQSVYRMFLKDSNLQKLLK